MAQQHLLVCFGVVSIMICASTPHSVPGAKPCATLSRHNTEQMNNASTILCVTPLPFLRANILSKHDIALPSDRSGSWLQVNSLLDWVQFGVYRSSGTLLRHEHLSMSPCIEESTRCRSAATWYPLSMIDHHLLAFCRFEPAIYSFSSAWIFNLAYACMTLRPGHP